MSATQSHPPTLSIVIGSSKVPNGMGQQNPRSPPSRSTPMNTAPVSFLSLESASTAGMATALPSIQSPSSDSQHSPPSSGTLSSSLSALSPPSTSSESSGRLKSPSPDIFSSPVDPLETTDPSSSFLEEVDEWLVYINRRLRQLEKRHLKRVEQAGVSSTGRDLTVRTASK